MRKAGLILIIAAVICLTCFALPAFAAGMVNLAPTVDIPDNTPPLSASVIILNEKPLSISELFGKVKACRQSLLETRLDVVKEANEAKQRLEEMLKTGRQNARSAESLKKDLETIKEAQRVLATILSDIINATTGEDAGAPGSLSLLPASGAAAAPQGERIPSREYLESLIALYSEKTQQLVRIVESLNTIVPLL